MTYICIEGGRKTEGEIELQGSKNAVLPMIAASLLIRGTTVIENCPDILDVREMLSELRQYGAVASLCGHTLTVDCTDAEPVCDPGRIAKTRGSVLFLGACLGRFHEAEIPYPGGCVIGARPIDLHLKMLRELGIKVLEKDASVFACGMPRGRRLTLKFPSVGATENVLLSAVCAEGTTVLCGAAQEPEVSELCWFLNKAGARITGIGTKELRIDGVKRLHETTHCLTGDRIVAGTLLCAAAATGGRITIFGTQNVCLNGFDLPLMKSGLFLQQKSDHICAAGIGKVLPVGVLVTAPYPAFPTDMQSIFMALLSCANGESRIYETLFESRFKVVPELCRMGAQIDVNGNCAVIRGTGRLKGSKVCAEELRGGAALLIAGFAAEGKTSVYGYDTIARGYENVCGMFGKLGMKLVRMEET